MSEDEPIPDLYAYTDDYINDTINFSITLDSVEPDMVEVEEEEQPMTPEPIPSTDAAGTSEKILFTVVQRICRSVNKWHSKCYRLATIASVGPALLQYVISKKRGEDVLKPEPIDIRPSWRMVRKAEMCIFSYIQSVHFPKERKHMIKNEIYWPSGPVVMGLKSPLDQFTPFIGVDRVIRAGGRIKDARVGYNQRHPVLLPRNDEDVRSYINHVHANNLHCGLEATLNATRQRVWILQGRAQIKVQLNKCVICQRRRKMPTPQLMGSVPEHRLKTIPPFTSTLCDLMGPFAVTRSGRKGSKAYVVVFTCGTYHAVSFEIIFSLTADEYIMALIRFNSRYP
ncbi:MAG: integrase zinc binding domain-containing protein, partial [Bacteroidota bacterium]